MDDIKYSSRYEDHLDYHWVLLWCLVGRRCWFWCAWCYLFFHDGLFRVRHNAYTNKHSFPCRFDPVDALVYTLIFDTTPVAFGALGIPVTTLASLTGLPVMALSAMMGRQLPIVSLFLPAYALFFYAGPRAGLIECWPVALIAGFSFALIQAIFANLVGPELPDLIAGLISLISVIVFVQYWKPPYRREYEANVNFLLNDDDDDSASPVKGEKQKDAESQDSSRVEKLSGKLTLLAWSPWLLIVVVVIM